MKKPGRLLITLLFILSLTWTEQAVRASGVRYAAPAAAGSGNCSDWENACTLQTALASAQSGDEIWVKAGVHKPTSLPGNREASFNLRLSVPLYGGFAGTETARDQRNWQANPTILSGDIDGNDTNNDGNFIAETWTDIAGENAYHVVLSDYMSAVAPAMDGFIITAGQAVDGNGGGLYNNTTELTLRQLIFSGNFASGQGGAIYSLAGRLTADNIRFTGNRAQSGGGIYNAESHTALYQVTFDHNSANQGGGLTTNYSFALTTVTLTEVTFSENSASVNGGGMANFFTQPRLTNVRFDQNTAGSAGGMLNDHANPTLINVAFTGNSSGAFGGGIVNTISSPTLVNVLFDSNTAIMGGGMFTQDHSIPVLTNVTFSRNITRDGGGGMFNYYTVDAKITNTVIWGNTPGYDQLINSEDSHPIIYNSDIQGSGGSGGGWNTGMGSDGGGNLDADPRFTSPGTGNLRPLPASPLIDAGMNSAITLTTDLSGWPRFIDIIAVPDTGLGASPLVDIGAYEGNFTRLCLTLVVRRTP